MSEHKRKTEICRALSKLGYCSRTQAARLLADGRVMVNGQICKDPAKWIDLDRDRIVIDSQRLEAAQKHYLMLNKPRGLVTSTSDEQGRSTVYSLFAQYDWPWVSPVGRLDKASEGLLLFSNDTQWAAGITDPTRGIDKSYHVQIDRLIGSAELTAMQAGLRDDSGHLLAAKHARLLRKGQRNCWLEIVLNEGRNRHIRRLLACLNVGVLRLIRVSIGPVSLGTLPKGSIRILTEDEVRAFSRCKKTPCS